MPPAQRVFRHVQHERYQREQLAHGVLRNVALEALDFLAVLVDYRRMRAGQFGREFEHVVHFDVVPEAWEDFDGAFGSVAGVVSMLEVGAVAEFFFYGEGEEGLADGELLVDFGLSEAEVGYVAGLVRVSDGVRYLGANEGG